MLPICYFFYGCIYSRYEYFYWFFVMILKRKGDTSRMKKITMFNVEKFLNLMDGKEDTFNDINWIEPIYIAMIRAYLDDNRLEISTNNSYIKQMIEKDYQDNKTYTPIENVKTRMGLEEISTHLSSIMLKNFQNLSLDDLKDLEHYLQYLFLELMNNVADHADSPVGGYVMAQYYPINKKVQFVVADRGIAFLENMKLNFSDVRNEEEAIYKALEKGVTSTKQMMYGQERNAGYGLYAMCEILKITGGNFVIISNDTLVRYSDKKFETKKLENGWKGVVVAFEFFEANINWSMDEFKRDYLWGTLRAEEDEDYF